MSTALHLRFPHLAMLYAFHRLSPQPHNAAVNLPTELLALIFSWLFSDDYDAEDSALARQKRHVEAIMLQAISHTCHRWRDVALGCSTLWGRVLDVNFSSLARIEEVIVRSKASPLFVQEMPSEYDWDSSSKWTAIFAHLHRFKVFHLILDQEIFRTEPLYLALCLPAPLLESFHLKLSCPDTEDERTFVSYVPLPNPIFAGGAPNLRDIFLHGCAFPKALPQNISLTSLKIVQADVELSASVAQWLQMVASCPELENLSIRDAFGWDLAASAHSPLLVVPLPRLRNLNILGDVTDCARLLGNLRLPASCNVSIRVMKGDEYGDDSFLGALRRLLGGWESQDPCMIWAVTIMDEAKVFILEGSDRHGDERLRIYYEGATIEHLHSVFTSTLAILEEMASIHFAETLHLSLHLKMEDYDDIKQRFNQFLSSFVRVSAVFVSARTVPAMLKTILRQLPVPSEAAQKSIAPAIADIILPSLNQFLTSEVVLASQDDYAMLYEYLLWRRGHGRPTKLRLWITTIF